MTAAALIHQLAVAGVALEVRDGKLRVDAPEGAITPDMREQLTRHKAAMLELLAPTPAATKGQCYKCGQPVTWLGSLAGLVNWLGEAVHLHCPAPPPGPAAPQPDPDQFDEEGYAAMRQDLITVIKDLAAEGKKVGQIARMFGLKPHEVWGVLRGQHG